jgi:hypothetical protein
MNMQLSRRQRGVTLIGWVIILTLVIGGALLVMNIGPIYMTHFSVKAAMVHTAKQPGVASESPKRIIDMVMKQLDINSVYGFDPKNLTVTPKTDHLELAATYDVIKPLVGNLSAMVSFDEKIKIPR